MGFIGGFTKSANWAIGGAIREVDSPIKAPRSFSRRAYSVIEIECIHAAAGSAVCASICDTPIKPILPPRHEPTVAGRWTRSGNS